MNFHFRFDFNQFDQIGILTPHLYLLEASKRWEMASIFILLNFFSSGCWERRNFNQSVAMLKGQTKSIFTNLIGSLTLPTNSINKITTVFAEGYIKYNVSITNLVIVMVFSKKELKIFITVNQFGSSLMIFFHTISFSG